MILFLMLFRYSRLGESADRCMGRLTTSISVLRQSRLAFLDTYKLQKQKK